MALHYVFAFFMLIGIVAAALVSITTADAAALGKLTAALFDAAKLSVDISIYLIGIMTLWLGFMQIAEKAGLVEKLSKVVAPALGFIFPQVPKNHPAMGAMMMNISANMLGLDNAATPLGLKAMNDLQALNTNKETASDSMIMFLVLNTSGLTLIPISVIALRAAAGASEPTDVFLPILLATAVSTLAGFLAVAAYQRINIFKLRFLFGFTLIAAILSMLVFGIQQWSSASQSNWISAIGNGIILLVLAWFIIAGMRKKLNVYDTFIEGAKSGFQIAIGIIPYLVAMLAAIAVFRAAGVLDLILAGLKYGVGAIGLNAAFIDALPTALMKPLSGSGARAMMVETMNNFGADSFAGRLSAIFQGSTETTFYTLAVYYGAVRIKHIRYTLTCGLIADLAGIVAAIGFGYLFFG